MNKKGAIADSDKILFWTIFVLPALIMIVALLIHTMPGLIDAQTKISGNLQKNIHVRTMITSNLCFAYQEPLTGRILDGHVALEKITDDVLHNCLKLEKRNEYGVFVQVYKEKLSGTPNIELHSKNALQRASSRSTEYVVPVIIIDENENQKFDGIIVFKFY